jgi:penicillin-insensitive murein endopeptidase
MRVLTWVAMAVLACGLAFSVPQPARAKRTAVLARVPSLPIALRRSRSVGLPWNGKLTRGVRLEPSRTIRHVTEYARAGDNFYGTWELVQLIQRAAHRVSVRFPGAKLSAGELSARAGGNLGGHASHENGRDADLGFYMRDAAGRPYEPFAFANFDARGQALAPNQGLSFDLERNWELVARLVADGDARVQYIFVAPAIRALLLAQGKLVGAPRAVLERAARVMVRPSEKHAHGNHFHVRIYCSPADRPKCRDRAPFWPWYSGSPR